MNYGGLATVIGHEIVHGFDNIGKEFDRDGNLFNWWTSKATKSFKERAQCIVKMYNNYNVTEIGLNVSMYVYSKVL